MTETPEFFESLSAATRTAERQELKRMRAEIVDLQRQ